MSCGMIVKKCNNGAILVVPVKDLGGFLPLDERINAQTHIYREKIPSFRDVYGEGNIKYIILYFSATYGFKTFYCSDITNINDFIEPITTVHFCEPENQVLNYKYFYDKIFPNSDVAEELIHYYPVEGTSLEKFITVVINGEPTPYIYTFLKCFIYSQLFYSGIPKSCFTILEKHLEELINIVIGSLYTAGDFNFAFTPMLEFSIIQAPKVDGLYEHLFMEPLFEFTANTVNSTESEYGNLLLGAVNDKVYTSIGDGRYACISASMTLLNKSFAEFIPLTLLWLLGAISPGDGIFETVVFVEQDPIFKIDNHLIQFVQANDEETYEYREDPLVIGSAYASAIAYNDIAYYSDISNLFKYTWDLYNSAFIPIDSENYYSYSRMQKLKHKFEVDNVSNKNSYRICNASLCFKDTEKEESSITKSKRHSSGKKTLSELLPDNRIIHPSEDDLRRMFDKTVEKPKA